MRACPAVESAESISLAELDVSRVDRFQEATHWPLFARLRRDDPVHWCAESPYGPYWSVTLYDDVVLVDRNHRQFSSAGNVIIGDVPDSFNSRAFIVADPPVHTRERRAVLPALSPGRAAALEAETRSSVADVLDGLPRDEPFDWVERVAVELTTRMVAALFAFPPAERHLLPWWSDVTMATPGSGADTMLAEERQAVLDEYLARLRAMWRSRAAGPPGDDLVSALAHCENTARMVEDPVHLIGTVTLLVGANDTTRSAISAAVVAFDRFPGEWERLRADPSLVPNAVSELVRWQTPLAHMRRTATEDVELRGKRIRGGDKVVMWYCSANRDERHFEDGDAFRVERPNARRHLSYGFGIHRCVGRHVAEMQLRVFLEELLERFPRVEVAGEPRRTASNFFAGWEDVPVRLPS